MNTPTLRILFILPVLGLCSTAHASIYKFSATLDGASEAPPIVSDGRGTAFVTYNSLTHMLGVKIDFADLTGTTTVAHIHAPTALAFTGTAGVATPTPTFPGFPAGVTFGSYLQTFDLNLTASFNPSFLTNIGGSSVAGAQAALLDAMLSGKAYVNVHTTFAPGGEIRGFLTQRVPDTSATVLLLGGALLTMVSLGRRFAR